MMVVLRVHIPAEFTSCSFPYQRGTEYLDEHCVARPRRDTEEKHTLFSLVLQDISQAIVS